MLINERPDGAGKERTMNDREQKQKSTGNIPRPGTEKENKNELSDEELNKVSGGASEITITKQTDGTSSKL